jgi:prenyl protein peptidase
MSGCLRFGSEELAVGYAVLCGILFVLSLYVRGGVRANRNDRDEIKRRMVAVLLAALLGVALLRLVYDSEHCSHSFLALCGVRLDWSLLVGVLLPLAHVVLLFAGPLLQEWRERRDDDDDEQKAISFFSGWTLLEVRSLVFAPVLEELVFRSLVCVALRVGAGWSVKWTVLVSALLFGAAHGHHVVHHVLVEHFALKRAIVAVLFQFTYTFLFGLYAAYVYVQFDNLLGVSLVHAFCNRMGFPDFVELEDGGDVPAAVAVVGG